MITITRRQIALGETANGIPEILFATLRRALLLQSLHPAEVQLVREEELLSHENSGKTPLALAMQTQRQSQAKRAPDAAKTSALGLANFLLTQSLPIAIPPLVDLLPSARPDTVVHSLVLETRIVGLLLLLMYMQSLLREKGGPPCVGVAPKAL